MKLRFCIQLIISTFVTLTFASCDLEKNLLIKKTAEKLNDKCPIEMKYYGIILQYCEYLGNNTIRFVYTVPIKINNEKKPWFKLSMRKMALDEMIYSVNEERNEVTEMIKELRIVMLHRYETEEGELICEIPITPEIYNVPASGKEADDRIFSYLEKVAAQIKIGKENFHYGYGNWYTDIKALYPRTIEYNFMIDKLEKAKLDTTFLLHFEKDFKPHFIYLVNEKYYEYKIANFDSVKSRIHILDKNRDTIFVWNAGFENALQ